MNNSQEKFGETAEKIKKQEYDGKIECYREGCHNRFFYEIRDSAFCSDECKAIHYGTSVDKLSTYVPKKNKRNLDEWIAYFKSPERKAMYHEQNKSATIEEKSNSNDVEGLIDFLSTPLGAEYATKSE